MFGACRQMAACYDQRLVADTVLLKHSREHQTGHDGWHFTPP
jgi:hypothetical protein